MGLRLALSSAWFPAALIRPSQSVLSRLRRIKGTCINITDAVVKSLQSFHLTPAADSDMISCVAISRLTFGRGPPRGPLAYANLASEGFTELLKRGGELYFLFYYHYGRCLMTLNYDKIFYNDQTLRTPSRGATRWADGGK